jgi:hypothetical protein
MKLKDLPPEAQNAYRVWKSGGDPLAQADQQGELGAVYSWATSLDDPDSAKFLSEQNLSREELNEVARINLLGAKAPVVQSGIEAAKEVRRTQEVPMLDTVGGPILEGIEQFSLNTFGTGARALQLGGEVLRNYPEAATEQARRERQPVGPDTPPEFRETSALGDFADEWGEMADRLHNAAGKVAEYSSRQGFGADVQRAVGGSVPYLATSPLGMPAIIGQAAASTASGKYAETGSVPQAMVAGSIEGVVTGAFGAAGLQGLEGAFIKGLRRGAMEAGKQTLAEVGEEETIFALQTIADMVAEGQDPSTVDWSQLGYEAAVTAAAAAGPTALLEGSKAFRGTPPVDTPPPPPGSVDTPPEVTVAQPAAAPATEQRRRRAGIASPTATPPGEVAPFGGFVPTEQEWETEYVKAVANPETPPPQIDDQPGIQTVTSDMAALSSLQDMSLYQIADPTPTGNANINSLKPGGTSISPVEIPISRFLEPPDTDTKHAPTIYLSGSIVPPPANIAESRVGNPARFSPDRRSVVVGEEESNLLFHIGLGGQFAESEGMVRAHQSEQGRSGSLTTSMPRVTLESSAKAAKQQADNLRLGIQMMNTGPQGVTSLTQDFLLDSLERAGKLDEQGLDVVEQVTANIQDLAVQRFTAIENILSELSETDRQRVKANPETAKEFFGNAILDLNVPPADLRRLLATNDRSVRLNYIAMDTAIDAINHVHGLMEIEQRLSIPDGADQLRGRKTSEVSILPVRPQNLPQSALTTVNQNGQVRVFADVPTGKNSLVQAKKQQQPPVGQRPGDVAPNELLYPKELRVKGEKGTSVTGVQQVGSHRLEGTNRMGMGYENGARPRKTDPVWTVKDRTGTKVGGRPTDYYTAMKKAQAYERAYQISREKYKMQELDPTPVQAPPEFGPLEPASPVAMESTPEMPGLLPEAPPPAPTAVEFESGIAEQGPRPMLTEAPLPLEVFEPLGGSPLDVAPKAEALPVAVPPRIANILPQYTELYAADPEAASEKLWFQMQEESEGGVDPEEFEKLDTMLRNTVADAKEAALIAPESGGARVIADIEEAAVVADDLKAQVETMLDAGIPIDQAVEAAAKAEGVSSAQAGQLLGPDSNTPAVNIKADTPPAGARLTVDPVKDGVKKARDKYFRKHADYLQNDDAVSTPEEIEDRLAIKKVFRETYGDTATEQAWQAFMRTGETPKMGKGAGKKAAPTTRRADPMPHGLTPAQLMSEESRSAPIKKASPEELVYMGLRPTLDRMQEQGADVEKLRSNFQGLVERTVKNGEWAAYAQLVEWTNGLKNGGRMMNNLHAAMKERGTAIPTDPLLKHDLPPDAVVPWSVNDPKERGSYDLDPSTPETEFLKTIDLNDPKYADMTDAQWERVVQEGIKKQPVAEQSSATEQPAARDYDAEDAALDEAAEAAIRNGDLEGASELYQQKSNLRRERLLESNDNNLVGIEASNGDGTRWGVILPEMSGGGGFRIQTFDKRGLIGHQTYNTAEQALDEMVTQGYRKPDKGAMDRLAGTKEFQDGNAVLEQMRASWGKPAPEPTVEVADAAPAQKQPWEMTREEFVQNQIDSIEPDVRSEVDDDMRRSWGDQWLDAINSAPRDAVVPERVYETLPRQVQVNLEKFNDSTIRRLGLENSPAPEARAHKDQPARRRAATEKEPQPRKRLAPTSAKIVNPNVALKTFRDTLKRAGIKPPQSIQGSKLTEDDFGGKLPPGYWNKDGAYSWDTALELAADLGLIERGADPSKLRDLLTGPASETIEVPLFSELYSGESLKVISIYGDEAKARRAIDNQRAQLVQQGEDTTGIDRLIAEFDAVAEEKTTSAKNQEDMFGYQKSAGQSLKPQATNSDFTFDDDDELPFRSKPRRIDPMDGMPALAEAMNAFDAVRQLVDAGALAYEKVKPHLSVLYRAAKDVPTFISNTVREFGEAIYAHALRVVAEYKALGNRGAALNPAAVLSQTRRRREALSKSFFGTKPGQTVAHWLKTGGNLNDASVKSLRKHKAWLLSMQKRTDLTNAEFSQILEELYGAPDKIPDTHRKQINNYINGDTSMGTFGVLKDNPKLLDNLTRMRREIDDLSQFMIDEGVVDGKLAATFGANIGIYLRRAYRIHNDPNWVQYLKAKDPATFNRLRAHIEDMHDTARVPFMERNELLSLAHLHFIKNPTGDSLANMKNADLVAALMQVTDTDISLRADDMTHKILLEQQEKNGGLVPMSNMVKGDTSILMRRKLGDSNFHLALRAAMGEFDGTAIGDIALNHTNSVLRIAKTLSAYRFLSDFKEIGMDPNAKFLWLPEEPGKAKAGATKQIVADNNRALAPLNGMYTTPEVYAQLMDAIGARSSMLDAFAAKGNGAPALVGAYRMLQFINGFAKMGKTVGSVPTQMVNMYGALWVQLEHGNAMTVKDVPHVYKTLRAWDQVKRGRGDAAAFRKKHAAVFERWVKHRLMDENPDVNEAMAQLMEFTDNTAMGKKLAGLYDKARKAMKQQSAGADKALDTATAVLQEIQDHYQRVDATGRIVFFEAELEKYRKALHGDTPLDKLSDAERQFLEDKAEDTAFKVYVNYTDVPRFVQEWRKQPFFGPFITFAFQRIRTTMNSAILIEKELTDPNPEVQKIGRRRAAGFAISQLLLTPTLSTMSMMAVPTLMASVFDGDDDEEEKIPGLDGSKHTHSWSDDHMLRRFLPDWLQNSQLFWGGVDRPEGAMGPVYHVGDLSRFDPSGQMKQALTAVTQGGAAGKSALDIVLSSAFQVLEPFTDPGLVGQTAYNLVAGRSAVDFEGIGREGGINTDIALEQANKIMYEIYELLKPGTVQYAERGYKGIFYEPASPYGRRNDPTNELLSMVTGMRSYPVDLGVALKQQGGAYKKRTADIVYDNYTQKVAYTGSEPVGSEDAIAKVSERMAREWDYLRASVQYSVKLGMTRNEVERALKDAGLSETDRSLLWRDREFPGWKPADQRKKSGGPSRRRRKL